VIQEELDHRAADCVTQGAMPTPDGRRTAACPQLPIAATRSETLVEKEMPRSSRGWRAEGAPNLARFDRIRAKIIGSRVLKGLPGPEGLLGQAAEHTFRVGNDLIDQPRLRFTVASADACCCMMPTVTDCLALRVNRRRGRPAPQIRVARQTTARHSPHETALGCAALISAKNAFGVLRH